MDLLLLHSPHGPTLAARRALWAGLLDARRLGLARSVGVSNFAPRHLDELEGLGPMPAVNQIEAHPSLRRDALERACRDRGVPVAASSPGSHAEGW